MSWVNSRSHSLSALTLAGALACAGAAIAQSSEGASSTAAGPPESGVVIYPATIDVQAVVPDQSDTPDSAFHKLDADNKGYVSEQDAAALPGFDEAFKDADVDQDGRLTPQEFSDAWASYARQNTQQGASQEMNRGANPGPGATTTQ